MNTKEMREKSAADLKKELLELCKEHFNLRMQKSMGEAPKSHLYKRVRRDIARVKTILNEKGRKHE